MSVPASSPKISKDRCSFRFIRSVYHTFINRLRLLYGTQEDQASSSVHKSKSFINTTYSPTLTLFAFHTNNIQYVDTLHIQKKKKCTFGCAIMTLIYSSEVYTNQPQYKSQKSIKKAKQKSVICTTRVGCSNFHISSI